MDEQERLYTYINLMFSQQRERITKVLEEYYQNCIPYGIEQAEGESPSRLLNKHIFKWRPWDRRAYGQYIDEEDNNTAAEFTKRLHEHFDVKVIGISDRDGAGQLEAVILINANAAKFDEYNKRVHAAHEEAHAYGAPVFDPATGEFKHGKTHTVNGGRPRFVGGPAEHMYHGVGNPLNDDMLIGGEPQADWKVMAKWTLKLTVTEREFGIWSRVTGNNSSTLSQFTVKGTNLSELGVQVMHRVFGNIAVAGDRVDLFDGVRQLLSGEKVQGAGRPAVTYDEAAVDKRIDRVETFFSCIMYFGIFTIIAGTLTLGFQIALLIPVLITLFGALMPHLIVPIMEANAEKMQALSINRKG